MAEYEYLDLPNDRARDTLPIGGEIAPEAWPTERIRVRLDYNNASSQWHWSANLVGYGQIIPRSPVKLDLCYAFRDKLRFIFHDPSGRADRVQPRNLGDTVRMSVWPGPGSSSYEPTEIETPFGEVREVEPWRPWVGYHRNTPMTDIPLRRFE